VQGVKPEILSCFPILNFKNPSFDLKVIMIQTILHQRGMDKNSLRSWQQGRQRVMVNIMDSIMDGSYSCLNWCPHSCRKKNIPSPCLRFPCIKTCKNLFDFNRSGYTRSTKWVDCFQIFITSLCQAFLILIQYSALNWCQERYVCGNSWDCGYKY